MRKLVPLLLIVAAILGWSQFNDVQDSSTPPGDGSAPAPIDSDWRSGQQVQGSGEVIRILADDDHGSRHQRFVLRLTNGRTLLIAHNIDLAPRVPSVRVGETISFNGEYEWNDKGGVIHWTHHDPQNRHQGGWLEHKGKRYQ